MVYRVSSTGKTRESSRGKGGNGQGGREEKRARRAQIFLKVCSSILKPGGGKGFLF